MYHTIISEKLAAYVIIFSLILTPLGTARAYSDWLADTLSSIIKNGFFIHPGCRVFPAG
jgi:hypothetical protein